MQRELREKQNEKTQSESSISMKAPASSKRRTQSEDDSNSSKDRKLEQKKSLGGFAPIDDTIDDDMVKLRMLADSIQQYGLSNSDSSSRSSVSDDSADIKEELENLLNFEDSDDDLSEYDEMIRKGVLPGIDQIDEMRSLLMHQFTDIDMTGEFSSDDVNLSDSENDTKSSTGSYDVNDLQLAVAGLENFGDSSSEDS